MLEAIVGIMDNNFGIRHRHCGFALVPLQHSQRAQRASLRPPESGKDFSEKGGGKRRRRGEKEEEKTAGRPEGASAKREGGALPFFSLLSPPSAFSFRHPFRKNPYHFQEAVVKEFQYRFHQNL